ncbi:MAG: GAF domain-containing protein, partial [bacterium]|nr:GAF domain-containing protein [bacterium]
WDRRHTLITPIYRPNNKIIGFIFADDPIDGQIPSRETIHTLELSANQISIALENRARFQHMQMKAYYLAPDQYTQKNIYPINPNQN